METILLMLSGGIDSTYLLYHYLTETRHPVHVHHISLRYPQFKRWIMEDPKTQEIIAFCLEHYREFSYSESRFDMESMRLVGSDQALQLLVASKIAPNLAGDQVTLALGHCYDDFDSPSAQARVRQRTMPRMWQTLIESGEETGRLNPRIAKPMVDLKMTKKEICAKFPEELLKLCWSCRKPEFIGTVGQPCGYCATCIKIEQVLVQMGKTADFPNLVRKRKSKQMLVHPDSGPNPQRFPVGTTVGPPPNPAVQGGVQQGARRQTQGAAVQRSVSPPPEPVVQDKPNPLRVPAVASGAESLSEPAIRSSVAAQEDKTRQDEMGAQRAPRPPIARFRSN